MPFKPGHKRTPEVIAKHRDTMRDLYESGRFKGPMHGKKFSEESLKKRAATLRAKVLGNRRKEPREVRKDGTPIEYWSVMTETGYCYEHRIVMEQILGRKLKRHEHVHHKNHDGLDNRPENLELIAAGEHSRQHWLEHPRIPPSPPRKPNDQWAMKHRSCVQCELTTSPHACHGICRRCNERNRRARLRRSIGHS